MKKSKRLLAMALALAMVFSLGMALGGTASANSVTPANPLGAIVVTYPGTTLSWDGTTPNADFAAAAAAIPATGGTITLNTNILINSLVTLTKNTTLEGNGNTLTVQGPSSGIGNPGLTITAGKVTIQNLNINYKPVNTYGAIFISGGQLTVTNCNFVNNTSPNNGYAIVTNTPTANANTGLTVTGCTFNNFLKDPIYIDVTDTNTPTNFTLTITNNRFWNCGPVCLDYSFMSPTSITNTTGTTFPSTTITGNIFDATDPIAFTCAYHAFGTTYIPQANDFARLIMNNNNVADASTYTAADPKYNWTVDPIIVQDWTGASNPQNRNPVNSEPAGMNQPGATQHMYDELNGVFAINYPFSYTFTAPSAVIVDPYLADRQVMTPAAPADVASLTLYAVPSSAGMPLTAAALPIPAIDPAALPAGTIVINSQMGIQDINGDTAGTWLVTKVDYDKSLETVTDPSTVPPTRVPTATYNLITPNTLTPPHFIYTDDFTTPVPPIPDNKTSYADITFALQLLQLPTITKTVTPTAAHPGDTITYTITVTNPNTVFALPGLTLKDDGSYPNPVTNILTGVIVTHTGGTADAPAAPTVTTTSPSPVPDPLPAGGTVVYTATYVIPHDATITLISNTAAVSSSAFVDSTGVALKDANGNPLSAFSGPAVVTVTPITHTVSGTVSGVSPLPASVSYVITPAGGGTPITGTATVDPTTGAYSIPGVPDGATIVITPPAVSGYTVNPGSRAPGAV
ncbi:MAG: DUF11 domain-containing protein, partial [Firmicutes bacterium]|nr:DUF11 domain-containing protein [Bacillota bacterium]